MAFSSGPISFRRFAVVGKAPKSPDQTIIDKLDELALRPGKIGAPEEIEYGWSGGRHVLDSAFSFDHNVFADCVNFALRIDTNKVPGELKKAYQIIEEEAVAAGNPSGFISKSQKKQVKESIQSKIDSELREGKYRRSKLVPALWDLSHHMLYSPATGKSAEMLTEIFERSFGCALEPLSAGSIALRSLEPRGRRRDYEDARPTRFVIGPEGESQYPEYPWTAKSPEPKDFFGNEFLTWLWYEADTRQTGVKTEDAGEVIVFIDKSLDLDCAYGQTGKDGFRGDGPGKMPEARDGLKTGKVPRKAGLILDAFKQQFSFTLSAEGFAFGGAKLPDVEEAETPRVLFEERIALLRDMCRGVDALYAAFLKLRCSGSWEGQVSAIRKWIQTSGRPVMTAHAAVA
jgi:hypothetical protein